MGNTEMVAFLVQIPRKHNSQNISVYSLLVESGYFKAHEEVTESDIRRELWDHPEIIQDWRAFSEDKRTTGWYLMEPSNGCYKIGYVPAPGENEIEPLGYQDEPSACAAYIKLELEDVRMTALRSNERRGKFQN